MRMLCDTPYILDPKCRVCPKLGELEAILEELLSEDGHKVLVFSEWERMLELVRELAERDEGRLRLAHRLGAPAAAARRRSAASRTTPTAASSSPPTPAAWA